MFEIRVRNRIGMEISTILGDCQKIKKCVVIFFIEKAVLYIIIFC